MDDFEVVRSGGASSVATGPAGYTKATKVEVKRASVPSDGCIGGFRAAPFTQLLMSCCLVSATVDRGGTDCSLRSVPD